MNNKQLVIDTLDFKNPARAPRDLWTLPWALFTYPDEYKRLIDTFQFDFGGVSLRFHESGAERGDPYEIGRYTDAWGCTFENIKRGIIGEVKTPLVADDDWNDADKIHIPEEWLSFDIGETNAAIAKNADKFILAGCPRPFEQLQFIRGTEHFYIDLITRPSKMFGFIEKMHDFYCRYLTKLAQTDVDGLQIMDDWGSQQALLINPATWRELFRPIYRDYIDIAKKYGKKIFMHSDGYILDIIPDLIDLGLDALNSQIFCMGIDRLKQFRGKITFWGEMDRQNLLVRGTPQQIRAAVQSVYENLWNGGGCIAQCEFGPGANPENVMAVYAAWNEVL